MLAEKSSASNAGEARDVAAVADETGMVFMEAFHHAYHPVYLRMLEIITSGEIGEVRVAFIVRQQVKKPTKRIPSGPTP